MEFIKLWTKLLIKYPSNYISAFLALNIHYWYIDADTIDKYSKRAYIEDYFYKIDYYTTKRESKLPFLYKIYHNIANYKLFEKLPLVSTLFSITIVFWLIMVTFFILIYKKDKKLIICLLPMLFLWLTHMAGPVSVLRYVFALYCCYPILIALIFQSKNLKIKSEL